MPVDRSMSVSLTDQSQRLLLTFRRTGSSVILDTWVDGIARESQVNLNDLRQLSAFLTDLVGARWSDQPTSDPSRTTPPEPRRESRPAGSPFGPERSGYLPPYPVGARWVPPPTGNVAPHSEEAASGH